MSILKEQPDYSKCFFCPAIKKNVISENDQIVFDNIILLRNQVIVQAKINQQSKEHIINILSEVLRCYFYNHNPNMILINYINDDIVKMLTKETTQLKLWNIIYKIISQKEE